MKNPNPKPFNFFIFSKNILHSYTDKSLLSFKNFGRNLPNSFLWVGASLKIVIFVQSPSTKSPFDRVLIVYIVPEGTFSYKR